MPSGSYTVFFSHSSSIGEYYNNQHDAALANRISVTAPQATSGIDAVLARGGAISGRVTAADTGLGLDDVSVDVYDLAGNQIDGTLTQGSGFYAFTTLPSGVYRVRFNATGNGNGCAYLPEYYNNQRTAASADTVSVTAPNTAPSYQRAVGARQCDQRARHSSRQWHAAACCAGRGCMIATAKL